MVYLNVTDGRTDRQTTYCRITTLCVASHGKKYYLAFLLFKPVFNNFLQVITTQRNFWLICRTRRCFWHAQYVQYNTFLIEYLPTKVASQCKQDQACRSNKTKFAAMGSTWQHVVHFISWWGCSHLPHNQLQLSTQWHNIIYRLRVLTNLSLELKVSWESVLKVLVFKAQNLSLGFENFSLYCSN